MPSVSYKCPSCGGELEFRPDTQDFRCAYCLSAFTKEELDALFAEMEAKAEQRGAEEAVKEKAEGTSAPDEGDFEGVAYTCPSCGAQVITDDTTAATFCYYCHNPVVLSGRLSGELRPERIIPFSIDKDSAQKEFLKWSRKKWFVPKDFHSRAQLEKITGLYIPFWITDHHIDASFAGTGNTVRVWRSGSTEYTETKEYRVTRAGLVDVDSVPKVALQKAEEKLIDGIAPYDMGRATDFSMAYLSGFFAEKYDLGKETVEADIRSQVTGYAEAILRDTVSGYSALRTDHSQVNILDTRWHYTLLPTWMLSYQFKDKTYLYALNGQTGKAYGELPLSMKRLGITFASLFAAVTGLLLLGGAFLW